MSELDLTFVDRDRRAARPRQRCRDPDPPGDPDALSLRAAARRSSGSAQLTEITPAAIVGVSTFYTQFRHRPVGRHIIHVCHGTACHVKGAELIQDAFQRRLEIADGDDTDADGLFTIQKVACLGCCTLAPVVQIDGVTYGRLAPTDGRRRARRFPPAAAGGAARRGAKAIAAQRRVGRDPRRAGLVLRRPGKRPGPSRDRGRAGRKRCAGRGETGRLRRHVPPDAAGGVDSGRTAARRGCSPRSARTRRPTSCSKHFKPRGVLRRAGYAASRWLDRLLTDEIGDPVARHAIDVRDGPVCAFLGPQMHLATEYCGQLDPTDLDEYLRHDGFVALRRCLEKLSPRASDRDDPAERAARPRRGRAFPPA